VGRRADPWGWSVTDSARDGPGGTAPSSSGLAVPLDALFAETVALFHQLRVAAEQLHGQGTLTAGRRGVLFELNRLGPRTVPQMARARPVSRQYMQSLVDQLGADELVELDDNPAHKRSRLVRLSGRGKALVDAMHRREMAFLNRLPLEVPPEQLAAAVAVLRTVRELLERPAVQLLLEAAPAETPRPAEPPGASTSSAAIQ
jgi:DNA-binding MarR family transcriptional regulator